MRRYRRNLAGAGGLWWSAWWRQRSDGSRADVVRSHRRRPAEHCDRKHHRGLLRTRRCLRRSHQPRKPRKVEGHRRRDVGIGAEHPTARGGHPSGGLLVGRHRRRRDQRHGVIHREAAHCRAVAALSQLHAGDRTQRRRHQHDRRHARQAGVHRIAELRHRGHRQPDAGSRRAGPQQGHRCAAHRTGQDRRGHEGRLDRCHVLVRRPAHRRDHRPVREPGRQGQVP